MLGITAFMTFNELNPPKKQGTEYRQTARQETIREKPKVIWDEFGKKSENEVEKKETIKEEVKEETKKEPNFKIEDTNVQEQNKIQNPEEVPKAG